MDTFKELNFTNEYKRFVHADFFERSKNEAVDKYLKYFIKTVFFCELFYQIILVSLMKHRIFISYKKAL